MRRRRSSRAVRRSRSRARAGTAREGGFTHANRDDDLRKPRARRLGPRRRRGFQGSAGAIPGEGPRPARQPEGLVEEAGRLRSEGRTCRRASLAAGRGARAKVASGGRRRLSETWPCPRHARRRPGLRWGSPPLAFPSRDLEPACYVRLTQNSQEQGGRPAMCADCAEEVQASPAWPGSR